MYFIIFTYVTYYELFGENILNCVVVRDRCIRVTVKTDKYRLSRTLSILIIIIGGLLERTTKESTFEYKLLIKERAVDECTCSGCLVCFRLTLTPNVSRV